MPRLKWIIALPSAALLLVVGGTWTYINVLRDDTPARLVLQGNLSENLPATSATTAASATAPASFDGTWVATTGSQAGYRVDEILFGQNVEAVGRTSNVDGALTIKGATVKSAAISIDLASVESDESRRDNQFRGRIMNVAQYPTATFTLTSPIDLGSLPAEAQPSPSPPPGSSRSAAIRRPLPST